MTPAERLTTALVTRASRGQRPRCGDPNTHGYWTSEEKPEREAAAGWCAGCPILMECGSAGRDQAWGVWGAVDVSSLKQPTTTKGKSYDN